MPYICTNTPPEAEAVIRRMFAALEAGGWRVFKVFDGEETERVFDIDAALEVIDSVEDSSAYFKKGKAKHWVLLIPCNGTDVIADHTYAADGSDNFDEIMDSLMEDES